MFHLFLYFPTCRGITLTSLSILIPFSHSMQYRNSLRAPLSVTASQSQKPFSLYTQTFYALRGGKSPQNQCEYLLQLMCHLVGGASAGPSRGLPGPLLGDAVDVVASPSGRVWVLLPHVHGLKRLLTWSRAGRLRQALLWLHFSVKRGVLPGELGQVWLCRYLAVKS